MIPYSAKRNILLIVLDAGIIILSLSLSLLLRFEGNVPVVYWKSLEGIFLPSLLIIIFFFALLGLYRTSWRYASVDELMCIVWAVSASLAGMNFYAWLSDVLFPRSFYVLLWFLLLAFVGASRLSLRIMRRYAQKLSNLNHQNDIKKQKQHSEHFNNNINRILIFGAGDSGVMVADELKKHANNHILAGFIDDNVTKRNQIIHGLPVLGTRDDIPRVVKEKGITEVVIAIPSASYKEIKNVVNICLENGVRVKTVPGIFEILEGRAQFNRLREVQIEDLLKREPVKTDLPKIAGYLSGQSVLVTGAGGSIGTTSCCGGYTGLQPLGGGIQGF
jgi:FlaA1/EpsC-like NDP-sugar epimerase